MSIGVVGELSAVPPTTLRYYEERGLIDPPARVGGKRLYGPEVLVRLMVIRFCRIAGLSLDEIADVINDTTPDRSHTKQIARRRVDAIGDQIGELELARDMMTAAARCRCPSVEQCDCGAMDPIVERLRHELGAPGI